MNPRRQNKIWQGKKDSNLCMLESKSSALTNLAIPLHSLMLLLAQQHQALNRLN
jgi:hypothetical protein